MKSVRDQMDAENLDYVLVAVNYEDGQPDEGLVNIHTHRDADAVADVLFHAATSGERAPQHFIERTLHNVFSYLGEYLSRLDTKKRRNKTNPKIFN